MSLTSLECLPDEILLLIYRYLSSTDMIFSFDNLNKRISQTINGFYRHVVLCQISFRKFHFICQLILPNIGQHISSLVISNDWKGVLSKIFLNYFDKQMSLIFPHLQYLILPTYRISSLLSMMNSLENLNELSHIKVMSLYEMGNETINTEILLERIFSTNKTSLNSIEFDDDCLAFSFENVKSFIYFHIEYLVIELKTINDCHRILTALPQLKSFDVCINKSTNESIENEIFKKNFNLKSFHLRTFVYFWTLNDLSIILQRMPNLDELFVQICTDNDIDLLDGNRISSLLSCFSLKMFHYSIQYEDMISLDCSTILSNWRNEMICIQDENDGTIFLSTLPINQNHLYLPYLIAKDSNLIRNYSSSIRYLTLFQNSSQLSEIFSILNQCHRLERLVLRVDQNILPRPAQNIQLHRLSSLIFFVSLENSSINIEDFKKLLEQSPNLYHLAINFQLIKSCFNNQSICELLKQRITHLLIGISLTTDMQIITNSITEFSSALPLLRHLYFHAEQIDQSMKSLILSVLKHLSSWKSLISFGVANIKLDDITSSEDVRRWVIENSHLTDTDSFLVDYSDITFRLWL